MRRLNKRGQEKYLSVWNFGVWIFVAVVILAAIYLSVTSKTDVRGQEANILAHRVSSCLVQNGVLQQGIISKNIFSDCSLDKSLFGINSKLYFTAMFLKDGAIKETNLVSGGNYEMYIKCQTSTQSNYPICYTLTESVFNSRGDKGILKIIAASNLMGVSQ